jgi:hypothetical protein
MIKRLSFTAMFAIAVSATGVHAASPCSATASQAWAASPSQKFKLEALAEGPACAKAVVMLVIRNGTGEPLWISASKSADIFTFAQEPPANAKAMSASLKQWMQQDKRLSQTGALPDWKKAASAPEAAEFPFYPEEGITRDDYTDMRNAKLPMFCHVAGMESEACLVLKKDGTIVKIGSQSFPG